MPVVAGRLVFFAQEQSEKYRKILFPRNNDSNMC